MFGGHGGHWYPKEHSFPKTLHVAPARGGTEGREGERKGGRGGRERGRKGGREGGREGERERERGRVGIALELMIMQVVCVCMCVCVCVCVCVSTPHQSQLSPLVTSHIPVATIVTLVTHQHENRRVFP